MTQNKFEGLDSGDKKTVDIDFEYVVPSDPYFHSVKALLNSYLDGED